MRKRIAAAALGLGMVLTGLLTPAPSQAAPAPIMAPAVKDLKGGVDAPKGRPTAATMNAKTTCSPTCFSYSGVNQFLGSAPNGADTAMVSTSQHKPALQSDRHSLFELAAQNNGTTVAQGNIVEVGYTMDPLVCGAVYTAGNPCLFVYHWVNGSPTCYNGCGWVDNPTEAVNAGTALATTAGGASPTVFYEYKIGRANSVKCDDVAPVQTTATTGWFIYQQNVGSTRIIGCFPDTIWTSVGETFTKINGVQAFDEIASTDDHPCSDMGSGVFAPATFGTLSASRWQKAYAISGAPAGVTASWSASAVSPATHTAKVTPSFLTPTAYRITPDTATPSNELRSGGPGFAGVGGTTTGSVGAC